MIRDELRQNLVEAAGVSVNDINEVMNDIDAYVAAERERLAQAIETRAYSVKTAARIVREGGAS